MKPTASFKLSRTSKRLLAREKDPHRRGEYKRLLILAQLHEEGSKNTRFNVKEEE